VNNSEVSQLFERGSKRNQCALSSLMPLLCQGLPRLTSYYLKQEAMPLSRGPDQRFHLCPNLLTLLHSWVQRGSLAERPPKKSFPAT
jgi:hypothetical protein